MPFLNAVVKAFRSTKCVRENRRSLDLQTVYTFMALLCGIYSCIIYAKYSPEAIFGLGFYIGVNFSIDIFAHIADFYSALSSHNYLFCVLPTKVMSM